MKLNLTLPVTLLIGALLTTASGHEPSPSVTQPQDSQVELRQIILHPEKYKNKTVGYTAPFHGFTRNAPPFLERSGFNEKKEVIMMVGGPQIPVVAKLKDVEEALTQLKRGTKVKVIGKLKEARVDPKRPATSGYYLELESYKILDEPPGDGRKKEPSGVTP